MALPLKSGADLYTQELLRARLHNFDGDLAEYGTGSIYFNTTSGLNTSDRIRYRGLGAWHSVANLEDIARLEKMIGNLDFAGSEDFIGITSRVAALEGNFTNGAAKDAVKFGGQLPSYYATQSAFSALQDKVNAFLDGDVDSDAVLENLKEIQAFLDSYDGATSLVDLLDTKADKSQLSGYLPLSGGTMQNLTGYMCPLFLLGNDAYVALGLSIGKNEPQAYLAFDGNELRYVKPDTSWNTLLHVNNFNSYAPTLTGAGASGTWGIDISGKSDSFNPQQITTADLGSEALLNRFFVTRNGSQTDMPTGFMVGFTMSADSNPSYRVQFGMSTVGTIYTRATHGASTYGDWKVVAFTDSNVATATKLQTARKLWGQSFDGTADVNGGIYYKRGNAVMAVPLTEGGESQIFLQVNPENHLLLGQQTSRGGGDILLYGNNIKFCYSTAGSSSYTGMILNSSGNVSIASWDYADTKYRFAVGDGRTIISAYNNSSPTLGNMATSALLVGSSNYGVQHWITGDGYGHIQVGRFDGTANAYHLILQELGGYVGIGTNNPQYKLDVNESIGVLDDIVNRAAKTYNSPFAKGYVWEGTNGTLGGVWAYGLNGSALERIIIGIGENFGTEKSIILNAMGHVGIGTPIPQEKLHVVGNLYVTGNIIADGQVSSGGVAEEGTGVGGSLERVTFTIPSGTTSFECEHNLGTKEISVSIYEEGGDYQQILADVYLDSTNIARIVFGRSTDVAHKVVIIG